MPVAVVPVALTRSTRQGWVTPAATLGSVLAVPSAMTTAMLPAAPQ